jgi:signal transduction histidine kinase
MSAGSASTPTEHRNGGVTYEPGSASGASWDDADGHARALERLTGVRSSKPSFYTAWREKSARLDRTIETLVRISDALCATPEGPAPLCEAVVEAAGHHFNAHWAAMTLSEPSAHELPQVIVHSGSGVVSEWQEPPPMLTALAERTLGAQAPVVVEAGVDRARPGDEEAGYAVAVPLRGEIAGVLAVGLPAGAEVEPSDLSILVTLANHAGVALHNSRSFQESKRRSRDLEGTRRRLEEAGRRQLLSQERNRIARELHDTVAQHLLTIGMNLEWCRRHESTSLPVLERVSTAKALARDAVDEIRAVIFELASDGQIELRRGLREVIEDVEAGTRLKVSFRTYGDERAVAAAIQHALLQIAREALFNVVRHANAERAWLTLRWNPGRVLLAVADDGCGRPQELRSHLLAPRPSGHHLGLAGIGERVRGLSGNASFERRPGGGVRLKVEVPLGGTVGVA